MLQILPDPPCDHCQAYCCKQSQPDINYPAYAVDIMPEEEHLFPEAIKTVCSLSGSSKSLPYIDGKCIHLGPDDRCSIYDRRPQLCRAFNCLAAYKAKGDGKGGMIHAHFLEDNDALVSLIETHRPEFCEER